MAALINLPDPNVPLTGANGLPTSDWYPILKLWALAYNASSQSSASVQSQVTGLDILTTRGDVLTRSASAYERLPIGAAGTLLGSDGTDLVYTAPGAIGLQLLTSGSLSAAATLDLALGGYTDVRGIIVELYALIPATDGVNLTVQFSTDNAASWIGANYRHAVGGALDTPGYIASTGSTSDSKIVLSDTTANAQIGNGTDEGINLTAKIMGWQLTSIRPRLTWMADYVTNAATPSNLQVAGGGHNTTAQDVTGLRFAFSSGNIASGQYAVYGLN